MANFSSGLVFEVFKARYGLDEKGTYLREKYLQTEYDAQLVYESELEEFTEAEFLLVSLQTDAHRLTQIDHIQHLDDQWQKFATQLHVGHKLSEFVKEKQERVDTRVRTLEQIEQIGQYELEFGVAGKANGLRQLILLRIAHVKHEAGYVEQSQVEFLLVQRLHFDLTAVYGRGRGRGFIVLRR